MFCATIDISILSTTFNMSILSFKNLLVLTAADHLPAQFPLDLTELIFVQRAKVRRHILEIVAILSG